MPPKKNKKSHNDFYYFMQDQKRILHIEGIHWDTMDELVNICHPRWKALSDDAKAKYKEIAKQNKAEARENLQDKYDSRGRSLASVEAEQRQREVQLEQMTKRIKAIIAQAKDMGALNKQRFWLIHINKLCQISEEKVLPCELAMVEFELGNGITSILHTFICPPSNEVPLGSGYEIQKNADETHGLTLEEDPMVIGASSDFRSMAEKVIARINPGGISQPVFPVYTLETNEEMTKNILYDLCDWARLKSPPEFTVFHVHKLMYQLSQIMPKNPERIKTETFAADQIASDIYSYTVGMACPYHDKIDKPRFCSLHCAKRWAFLIMDHCCPILNIEQKEDTHYHVERPLSSRYALPYKQEMLVQWTPSLGDDGTQTSTEVDRDIFGAAKTRAAPAGFVAVDESLPNPKKMTTKERDEWTKKLAAQGKSFAEWTEMVKALPEEPPKPWAKGQEPQIPWAVPQPTSKVIPLVPEPPCPWATPNSNEAPPLIDEPPCPWDVPKTASKSPPKAAPWALPQSQNTVKAEPKSNPWAKPHHEEPVTSALNNDTEDFPSLGATKSGRRGGRKK